MAVRLQNTTKPFIGLSTDIKPDPSVTTTLVLPVGSSFLEEDTGRIFLWDGETWTYRSQDDDRTAILAGLLEEIRDESVKTNERLELILSKF